MAVIKTNKELSVWRGTNAQYTALTTQADTIYYVTDTGLCYVGTSRIGAAYESVQSFPVSPVQGVIYFGPNGEAKYWNGTAWVVVCYPLTTSVTSTSTDTEVPSALAVYTYVNTLWSGMGKLLPAVQNVTELKAITGMGDKDLVLVEDVGNLYRFDADSSATEDDDKIVAPTTGTGRWLKMYTAVTLTGGNGISVSGTTISIDADSNLFEFSSGVLTLKSSVLAAKMNLVTSPTANNVLKTDANGQAVDSGYAIGGDTIDSTQSTRQATLATEEAVYNAQQTAINNAKLFWMESEAEAGE